LVAFTITITRIALSPLLVEAAPAPYPDDERAAPGSTSRRNFFSRRAGGIRSPARAHLTVAQKPHSNDCAAMAEPTMTSWVGAMTH
jgi:hypothetical protein